MRAVLLTCALAACGKPPPRPTDITTVPTNAPVDESAAGSAAPSRVPGAPLTWKTGPGEFPIPSDAKDAEMPGSAVTFQVPHGRDEVHAQLLEKLKQDGFVVDQQQMLMGGYRMDIHRDTQKYFVSVTENGDTESLFTITVK